MNKLVSKNSVQRFKQGKKILKAQGGMNSKKVLRTKYFPEEFDKNYTHNFLTLLRLGYRKINGAWMSPEEQKQNKRAAVNKGTVGTRSTTTPRFLSKYANMANTIGGANNIKVWQQKLKNYYTPGTYNPDSVWGDNTQAAYERYLAEQNNNINLGLEKLNPVSISPVKESVQQNDFAQDKQTGYPSTETIQSSSSVLNQQNDFASDRQNYYPSVTMSTPSTETVPVQQNDFASQKSSGYQSGQSRGAQLFNNITLRPEFKYGYWRMFNTNPFTIYSKQGSKLVYKNPIKRFKSNFR